MIRVIQLDRKLRKANRLAFYQVFAWPKHGAIDLRRATDSPRFGDLCQPVAIGSDFKSHDISNHTINE